MYKKLTWAGSKHTPTCLVLLYFFGKLGVPHHACTSSSAVHAILFSPILFVHSFIMSLEWKIHRLIIVSSHVVFCSLLSTWCFFCFASSHSQCLLGSLALQWQYSCSCTLQCAQYRSFSSFLIINNSKSNNNNNWACKTNRRRKKHRHSTVHNELHLFTDDSLTVFFSVSCVCCVHYWFGLLTSFVSFTLDSETECVAGCVCVHLSVHMDRKSNDPTVRQKQLFIWKMSCSLSVLLKEEMR